MKIIVKLYTSVKYHLKIQDVSEKFLVTRTICGPCQDHLNSAGPVLRVGIAAWVKFRLDC